jgi:diguanylate cyclase (GGDEF)-like protein
MSGAKGADRSTDRLLRLLDEPHAKGESILGRLDAIASETGRPVHAELLRLLTHLSFPNEAARQVWSGYQLHHATLQRKLGRDVGPRVALFDYLLNVERRLSNPKIIELSDFEKTEKSAITDHLTALFNRAHFDGCLKKEINRCRRYGQCVSVVVMDLDDFKSINDTFGHPAGDQVLKEVGRLLIQRVRDIDVAARYGGEEFAVILPETRRMSAFVVAERVRSEIERYFRRKELGSREARVTISGGISSYPEDAETPEALVAKADEALYRAKRQGKNRVAVYFTEKRKASRIDVGAKGIRVHLDGSRLGDSTSCRALNISEGGVLLESPRPLRLGQSLALKLALGRREEIHLEGEVVRLEERQTAKRRKVYDAGVRFRFGRRSLAEGLSRFIRESTAASA